MTPKRIEALAQALEREAASRRHFAATPGFDSRTHTAAADAYQHSATMLRQAQAES